MTETQLLAIQKLKDWTNISESEQEDLELKLSQTLTLEEVRSLIADEDGEFAESIGVVLGMMWLGRPDLVQQHVEDLLHGLLYHHDIRYQAAALDIFGTIVTVTDRSIIDSIKKLIYPEKSVILTQLAECCLSNIAYNATL